MELNEEMGKVLGLFKRFPEISRRHLTNLFPNKCRSAKYSILKALADKGLLQMHFMSSATFYTLTDKAQAFIST